MLGEDRWSISEKSASNIVIVLATGSSLVGRFGIGQADVKTSTISSSKDMLSSYDSISISKRSFSMSWNAMLLLGEVIPQDSNEGRRKETSMVGRNRDSMFAIRWELERVLRRAKMDTKLNPQDLAFMGGLCDIWESHHTRSNIYVYRDTPMYVAFLPTYIVSIYVHSIERW
mmetsp:Transcript_10478/g.17729  ORF Transcript_10478/g.17729 Transcript_10478/m.17729 type:complete len:172 (+) Transcript_10478:760-1275(+)